MSHIDEPRPLGGRLYVLRLILDALMTAVGGGMSDFHISHSLFPEDIDEASGENQAARTRLSRIVTGIAPLSREQKIKLSIEFNERLGAHQ